MALIVEDGTGKADAESYVSVAECDAFHVKNGGIAWDDVDDKEAALREATRYLDSAYVWKSSPVRPYLQALEFPRVGYLWSWPDMRRIKDACCLLALKAASGGLFADVEAQHVTSVEVGPIQRSMSAPANGGQKRYAAVDALVRPMVRGSGGVQVVRA